ncbi:hypothetical protein BJ322DRAFT_1093273 [Thelephora terrestris]|uniref:Uncharacterized protein n=1 Tax=Thelephora terrestris TaxID=56493 RepID=A0A9P6L1K2_9AGAM|nr:hypothetical protein BJ322DRAFT_1093273 [Thelephora terrestris]
MRVSITNALVLTAIYLVSFVSGAPHAGSSVDSNESYPNSTTVAQGSGTSSSPNAPRDEAFSVESFYDNGASKHFFEPLADFFKNIGVNTMSDHMPPTEEQNIPLSQEQKADIGQLHQVLSGVVKDVTSDLRSNIPVSPPVSRSLGDAQLVNLPASCDIPPVLGETVVHLSQTLMAMGIGKDPTTPLTDVQKQMVAKIKVAIGDIVKGVAANAPEHGALPLPFNHARSVPELPQGINALTDPVKFLDTLLDPLRNLVDGATQGKLPVEKAQEMLSRFDTAITEANRKVMDRDSASTVHIQNTREEHERWDHHHDQHRDGHHDQHMDDHHDKHMDEHHDQRMVDHHVHHELHRDEHHHDHHEPHRDHHQSHDNQEHDNKSWEAHKGDDKSGGAQQDDGNTHNAREDGRKSPDAHSKDRHAHSPGRDGDHCRGSRDECKHHHDDGKDRKEDPALLKISLGNSHHRRSEPTLAFE